VLKEPGLKFTSSPDAQVSEILVESSPKSVAFPSETKNLHDQVAKEENSVDLVLKEPGLEFTSAPNALVSEIPVESSPKSVASASKTKDFHDLVAKEEKSVNLVLKEPVSEIPVESSPKSEASVVDKIKPESPLH